MRIAPEIPGGYLWQAPGSPTSSFQNSSASEGQTFGEMAGFGAEHLSGPGEPAAAARSLQSPALSFDELGMFGLSGPTWADSSTGETGPQSQADLPLSNRADLATPASAQTAADGTMPLSSQGVQSMTPDAAMVETAEGEEDINLAGTFSVEEVSPAVQSEDSDADLLNDASVLASTKPEADPVPLPPSQSPTHLLIAEENGELHVAAATFAPDAQAETRWRQAAETTAAEFGKRLATLSLNGKPLKVNNGVRL